MYLEELFINQTSIQAVVVIAIICAIGMLLGRIKVLGISLGVTFVFFIGILAGHLGFVIDHSMLTFAQNFGLVLFVYALGLQVGPGFFSSFRKGGVKFNLISCGVILAGTLLAVALSRLCHIEMEDMIGLLCGATTNTPALAAAQQTLAQMGLPVSGAALSCAVTYPLGVVGVIIAIIIMRKLFVTPARLYPPKETNANDTFIATFHIINPGVIGKTVKEIAAISNCHFVISRLWRNGQVMLPDSGSVLEKGDRVLIVTTQHDTAALSILLGEQESTDWNKENIDWNSIDRHLLSQTIIVTKPEINGKKLGSLRLRNTYGVNISRVYRSDVPLLATPSLVLQLGDKVTVVGEQNAIHKVADILGNVEKALLEPNLASIFIGIMLGLALGAIPFAVPGISMPVKLGLAGGPIIMGILMGTFGPRLHMVTYTTASANLMLRGIGLAIYLACLGLDSGAHFLETVIQPQGMLWIGVGFVLTLVPVLVVALISLYVFKTDFATLAGIMCGSMANPMALSYANETIPGDTPSVSYATVYPLGMFLRVILAQIVLMLCC